MEADVACTPTCYDMVACESATWCMRGTHMANIKEEIIVSSALNGKIFFHLKWLPYLYPFIFINLSNVGLFFYVQVT